MFSWPGFYLKEHYASVLEVTHLELNVLSIFLHMILSQVLNDY